ncbi:aminoglycoside phosphotransferase family protein [Streptomyces sp. SL13]|uniref:Aminoglycoside phosphotransferase family protein n=1 Tax=Streptantibioticus silvisoli TaxID=2705255 RepID=A0AA90H3E6_9ACTN|nr:aminoglycoside phosphotransferase family protein [Streptantibioticus silvisoli]MDI5970000.1 aminoglycoside phosphotransferase family protein [Streptantibioticus silvisoli]
MPHAIDFGPDHVVKHFGPGERDGYERELRALTLLAEHAPGLAPRPLPDVARPAHAPRSAAARTAAPSPDGPGTTSSGRCPPPLRMTRVPGAPLRGTRVDGRRTAALAAAVGTLHDAVPPEALARVPLRPDGQDFVRARLRAWSRNGPGGDDPLVAEAARAGLAWLAHADLAPPPHPVFGPGDGNLANYLWDGSRVRVVDFESSGRSDRAYELAEITEHVSGWTSDAPGFAPSSSGGPARGRIGTGPPGAGSTAVTPTGFASKGVESTERGSTGIGSTGVDGAGIEVAGAHGPGTEFDAEAFLGHFDLTDAERARLDDCRRLLALAWVFMLSYDDPARPRNPPGTARHQASRLLARLNA